MSEPGMEVLTVSSRHAGVDEVAYLVKVDGLVLFHGGDYQGGPARGAASNAVEDMRALRAGSPPDLVFLGAWTGDPYLDIVRGLEPRVIFPGHARKQEEKYLDFAADLRRLGVATPVVCPKRRGDSFVYRGGSIAEASPATTGPRSVTTGS